MQTDDLPKLLRARADRRGLSAIDYTLDCGLDRIAADEIERLREALRYYAKNHYPNIDDGPWGPGSNDFGDVARAALGEEK
jgi:hypothetical protein